VTLDKAHLGMGLTDQEDKDFQISLEAFSQGWH
jgi:hypothetical protein